MLRQMARSEVRDAAYVCAFVKTTDRSVLKAYGCQELTRAGNISIANIPVAQLGRLSQDRRVRRIEARPLGDILMDSVARQIGVLPLHEGTNLPQAFTGKDVVVGVMDIGFDLTHPNFYDRTASNYRIKRLWDFLSTDTVGSPLYVGRDYTTTEELLALAHSRDGEDQTHGTHTLGIAAGSGYTSKYRGVAFESDLCLVANAVSSNAVLIDSANRSKFTFATDALGFKYIFDYATSVNKPCVISFSEGSPQDFWGYDLLYYEMIDQMVGPGRILVAAAGNQGAVKSWFRKPKGQPSTGSFFRHSGKLFIGTLKSADDFQLRLTFYEEGREPLLIDTRSVVSLKDSLLTLRGLGSIDSLQVEAYPSCFNPDDICYDVMLYAQKNIGIDVPLSLEVIGTDADVEYWRYNGSLYENTALNSALNAGECVRNIHSPSSCPRVICVGANMYRQGITNYMGEWKSSSKGGNGLRNVHSSVGPTTDGRTKPDVMAPGINIISSYSSYYLEHHPDANDITWDVEHFTFNGRTYPWNSCSGTSMSCPAVAGTIALWLQAKPDLTPEEALDVIAHTSRHPDTSLTYPTNEYGYGEIDAYAGLLYLLKANKIEGLSAAHTTAQLQLTGRDLQIWFPQPTPTPACLRIYTLDGRMVYQTRLTAGQQAHAISLAGLPAALYAVQIDGTEAGSTLLRLK